jgi:hypothetical protein
MCVVWNSILETQWSVTLTVQSAMTKWYCVAISYGQALCIIFCQCCQKAQKWKTYQHKSQHLNAVNKCS